MEEIKGVLLLLTTLVSIIVVCTKFSKNFFMELIKSKYTVTPGIKTNFETVIKWVIYTLAIVELLSILAGIIDAIINKENNNYIEKFNANSVLVVLVTVIIFGILLAPLFSIYKVWGDIVYKFIEKLEKGSCKEIKYKKIKIWLNIGKVCALIISGLFIYIILKLGTKYIVANLAILPIGCASIIEYIILYSLDGIMKAVKENRKYILNTNHGGIYCPLFLEYKEYYLVIQDGIERYIKISEVKEIVKR